MPQPKREPIFNWSPDLKIWLIAAPIGLIAIPLLLLWLAGVIIPIVLWALSPVLYLPHLLLQP